MTCHQSPGPNDNYFFKRFQEAYSNHEEGIIMNPYQTVIPVSNSYWYDDRQTTHMCREPCEPLAQRMAPSDP